LLPDDKYNILSSCINRDTLQGCFDRLSEHAIKKQCMYNYYVVNNKTWEVVL